MDFGDCDKCGDYKFLGDGAVCQSCQSDECWAGLVYEYCDQCDELLGDCTHTAPSTYSVCAKTDKKIENCSCDGFCSNDGPDFGSGQRMAAY